jgi:Mor family transcriptional regulator
VKPRNTELFDLLGEEGLAALARRWGGVHFEVPKGRGGKTWHALEDAIGPELAGRLVERFGGDRLDVPRLCARTLAQRNVRLHRERWEMGKSVLKLAREYGLTERWVRAITNERDPQEQLSLF